MRKKTLNMLQKYARGIGSSEVSLKLWWKGLSTTERATMSKRIQAEMSQTRKGIVQ